MRRLHVKAGLFNGGEDTESAEILVEATEENEVLAEIRSTADHKGRDDRPYAGVYMNPVEALEYAADVRQAALDALADPVKEERG